MAVVVGALVWTSAARPQSPSGAVDPTSALRSGSGPGTRRDLETQDREARERASPAPLPKPDAPPPPRAKKAPAKTRFRIARVLFEGNTVIPTWELKEISGDYENREVALQDLREMTVRLRTYYQSRGYLLASAAIPPQRLKSGGDVKVRIIEGKFGKVRIEGNKFYTDDFIRRFFGPAMRGGLVRERQLQRALLVLNEIPDLSVRSLFVAGAKPGTSDVVLKAHDRRSLHYSLDYNNYGNPLIGRNRAGIALFVGQLFAEGEELSLRYTEPFPSESDPLYQAGYTLPIGDHGSRLGYAFASAATKVGGDLALLSINGDAKIHSLSYQTPLVRTLRKSSNLTAGFIAKRVRNFVVEDNLVSQDDIRVLTAGYDQNSVETKSRTLSSYLVTQGLGEIFGGRKNGDFLSSRVGSGNEFSKLNVELFHIRELDKGKYLLARFSGQKASDPMTVSEQFALGGPDSVRGFIQSEGLFDDGYSTSIEYRQLVYTSSEKKVNVQVAAFFDHGDGSLQRPQVGERESRSLTGIGLGTRMSFGRTTSLRVDVGHPLSDMNQLGKDFILYAQQVSRW
jgi:hemolysin activation/secretion protein